MPELACVTQLRFEDFSGGKPYREQIKLINFLLSVPTKGLGELPGTAPERLHLVAPYTREPEAWGQTRWLERYSGEGVPVTTRHNPSTVVAEVRSCRYVIERYRTHPEPTSLGPDGKVCDRQTRGLLQRRPVTPRWIEHVGKESNRLEEVEKGAVRNHQEVRETYREPARDYWDEVVVPWMQSKTARELARMSGLSERQIRSLRNQSADPTHSTCRILESLAESV